MKTQLACIFHFCEIESLLVVLLSRSATKQYNSSNKEPLKVLPEISVQALEGRAKIKKEREREIEVLEGISK